MPFGETDNSIFRSASNFLLCAFSLVLRYRLPIYELTAYVWDNFYKTE